MAPPQDTPRVSPNAVLFFFVLLVGASGAFAYVLWDFVSDLVVGFLLAALARPAYEALLKRLGGRTTLAASLSIALLAITVLLPMVWLVVALSGQATTAYRAVHDALASQLVQDALRGEGWIGRRAVPIATAFGVEYTPDGLRSAAANAAGAVAGFLTSQLNAVVTNVVLSVYHFVLVLVVAFYGFIDGERLKERIFELSPLPDEEEELIVQKFKDVGAAILFGSGAASVIQGTLGGVAMLTAGIPSPLFWGVIMAIFAFLPLVGTNLVVIPATLYLLVTDHVLAALLFFAFCNVQGLLIDNLLTPRLVGNRMRMHNLLIFLALIGGIGTFGMGGLIYGPLICALVITLLELYDRVYRERIFGAVANGARHG
jgi:predicted PurR-regulated permease PerM